MQMPFSFSHCGKFVTPMDYWWQYGLSNRFLGQDFWIVWQTFISHARTVHGRFNVSREAFRESNFR
jgi:hypothetical protein